MRASANAVTARSCGLSSRTCRKQSSASYDCLAPEGNLLYRVLLQRPVAFDKSSVLRLGGCCIYSSITALAIAAAEAAASNGRSTMPSLDAQPLVHMMVQHVELVLVAVRLRGMVGVMPAVVDISSLRNSYLVPRSERCEAPNQVVELLWFGPWLWLLTRPQAAHYKCDLRQPTRVQHACTSTTIPLQMCMRCETHLRKRFAVHPSALRAHEVRYLTIEVRTHESS